MKPTPQHRRVIADGEGFSFLRTDAVGLRPARRIVRQLIGDMVPRPGQPPTTRVVIVLEEAAEDSMGGVSWRPVESAATREVAIALLVVSELVPFDRDELAHRPISEAKRDEEAQRAHEEAIKEARRAAPPGGPR